MPPSHRHGQQHPPGINEDGRNACCILTPSSFFCRGYFLRGALLVCCARPSSCSTPPPRPRLRPRCAGRVMHVTEVVVLTRRGTFTLTCVICRTLFLVRYVGQWENDLQHGQGTFYFADSSCFRGVWMQVRFTNNVRACRVTWSRIQAVRLTRCTFVCCL